MSALDLEDQTVDHITDDARQEDHERVDDTLDQRERHHVAVGDVRDLVGEHSLGFALLHVFKKPGADRDQSRVPVPAGGERIDLRRLIDRDLGHPDARLLRLALHCGKQPAFRLVRGRLDHMRAGRALGHPFRDQQREQRAAEAHYGRHHQQCGEVEAGPALVEDTVYPQQPQSDAQHEHHGNVGQQEQKDAFHFVSGGWTALATASVSRGARHQPFFAPASFIDSSFARSIDSIAFLSVAMSTPLPRTSTI